MSLALSPRLFGLALSLVVTLAATCPARASTETGARDTHERHLVVVASAEIHGALEPCGCTSDPLGDVSRLATLLRTSRAQEPTLFVDSGNSFFPEGALPARGRPSAEARAQTLAKIMGRLGVAGLGLGDTDFALGVPRDLPKRLASNLTDPALTEPPKIIDTQGIKVGLLGVVDAEIARAAGLAVEEALPAAKRDATILRNKGAELIILLAPVDRALARKLAREADVDFVILGRQVGKGNARPEKMGQAYVLTPQDELQRVVRLEVVLRRGGETGKKRELISAGSSEEAALRKTEVARDLSRLDAALAEWAQKGVQGDFVAAKKREREALLVEQSSLNQPWRAPAEGDYFQFALVPLRRSIPQDGSIRSEMKALDRKVAALNLKAAEPPPKAEPGRAFFVGDRACVSCHKAAVTFWKKTVHAQAWKTLVDVGKQADEKCVGCHVTGFGQVGGSSLGFTRHLENVQCENCHGPGSNHVAGEGNEEPLAIRRDAPESTCTTCHTEQHSDTFKFDAYLRDIVGPGHGNVRREKLGAGPTGHELRTTALAQAALESKREQATRALGKRAR